jgi:hypothetical protein
MVIKRGAGVWKLFSITPSELHLIEKTNSCFQGVPPLLGGPPAHVRYRVNLRQIFSNWPKDPPARAQQWCCDRWEKVTDLLFYTVFLSLVIRSIEGSLSLWYLKLLKEKGCLQIVLDPAFMFKTTAPASLLRCASWTPPSKATHTRCTQCCGNRRWSLSTV